MNKIFGKIILIFLFLQFFTGCQKKETSDFPFPAENNFTLEQAQAWYGSDNFGILTLKSGSINSNAIGIKPDWCNSIQSQNTREDLFEVGLWMTGGFGFADEKSYKEWTDMKDPVSIGSLTRMVFLKSKDDGKILNFLMTIVGDNNYHHDKASQLSKNSYLSKEKNFSGYVFYHDLNGNFVNGWKYEKGSVVAKTTMIKGGNIPTQLKLATTCTESTIYVWMTICKEWYQTSNTYEGAILHTECTTDYFPVTVTSCTGDGNGGGSGTTGGGSTGGYTPTPTPPPSAPAPDTKLSKIENVNSLDQTQKNLLETALNELINLGCLGAASYNNLVQTGTKINFAVGGGETASYDPSIKTLTFFNTASITSGNLQEELFHAAQDAYYAGGTNQYRDIGFSNVEFEAKLYRDMVNLGCCTMFQNDIVPPEIKKDYFLMVDSFKSNGATSFTPETYKLWVDRFRTYNPSTPYTKPQSANFTNTTLLNSILGGCTH